MDLRESQTAKNLMAAFAGESQARNRDTYYASAAKKEGLVQISDIFEETACQEREHAKRLFKLMQGGEVEITGEAMDRGVFGAPTFFVGDEMFWGGHRLTHLERYLGKA